VSLFVGTDDVIEKVTALFLEVAKLVEGVAPAFQDAVLAGAGDEACENRLLDFSEPLALYAFWLLVAFFGRASNAAYEVGENRLFEFNSPLASVVSLGLGVFFAAADDETEANGLLQA